MMVDAQTANEQLYCSQQINVPLNLPYILKQYAKAAIRTQPADLLFWSAVYFRALASGRTPPVKERIEYPPITTPSGLSPGFLKLLINQFGNKKGIVSEKDIIDRWLGIGLKLDALNEIFKLTGIHRNQVRWLNFVSVSAGYLCPSLTQTMILLCELLTDDPEGGPATIDLDTFLPIYKFLARLNCGPVPLKEKEDHSGGVICITAIPSQTSFAAQSNNVEVKSLESETENSKEKKTSFEGRGSTEGLMVWQDVEPPLKPKEKSPNPSDEGLLSDHGLDTFEITEEDATTPGYTEESMEKSGKKITRSTANVSSVVESEIKSDKVREIGERELRIEQIQLEKKEEIDSKSEEESFEEDFYTEEVEEKETRKEELEIKEDSEEQGEETNATVQEMKTAVDLDTAEGVDKEEDDQIKPETESSTGKLKSRGGKKKKKKAYKVNEAGEKEEQEAAAEEEEEERETEEFGDDEFINEEDYDESSSSESVVIDVHLLQETDYKELEDDEELVEEEIDEEFSEEDDNGERRKVTRKVKKIIKRKKGIQQKVSEEIPEESLLQEAEEEILEPFVKDESYILQSVSSESVDALKLKGKQKKEVYTGSILNLCASPEEVSSLSSEPETWETSFVHIPGIGPRVSEVQIAAVVKYMKLCAVKQAGFVMPRNIRHFLCPPLEEIHCEIDEEENHQYQQHHLQ